MVTIRLTRRGAKKQPFYHVVVTDSRLRQVSKGAQPSDRVAELVKKYRKQAVQAA